MSIMDAYNTFFDSKAVATGFLDSATAFQSDIVDLKAAGDFYGKQLYFHCTVNTTLDSAGEAATLKIELKTDGDSAFGSAVTLLDSTALAESVLIAGKRIFQIPLPKNIERYLRVTATVGTEAFTSGAISAWISDDVQQNDFRTKASGQS
jgi:hypothetical protein